MTGVVHSKSGELVGRYAEMNALDQAVKQAEQGRPSCIVIEGHAGTGKTTLLRVAQTHAESLGFRLMTATAEQLEQALPFACISRAVEEHLAGLEIGEQQRLAGVGWESLRLLFPDQIRGEPAAAGPEQRVPAYVTFSKLLSSWSEQQPILLTIDDLHWADEGTLELLHVVIGRLSRGRCSIVLAGRPREAQAPEASSLLWARLSEHEAVTRLGLDALDASDCRVLVARELGSRPDDALVGQVYDETKGNPFFALELIRALREAGRIRSDGERAWINRDDEGPLLGSVAARTSVLRRLASLGPEAVTVARALSVAGVLEYGGAAYTAALGLCGMPRADVDGVLDRLVRAAMVMESTGRFEFAHPIVRTLVYDDIGAAERRGLHARMAESLQQLAQDHKAVTVADVAVHISRSAAVGDADAAAVLAQAGDESLARAPAVAAGWFREALRLIPPQQATQRAMLELRLARALFVSDELAQAVEAARRSQAYLPAGPQRAASDALLVTALSAQGRLEEALAIIDRAVADADPADAGRLLAHRLSVLLHLGRLDEAEALVPDVYAATESDLPARVLAEREVMSIAFERGRYDECWRLIEDVIAHAGPLPPAARAGVLAFAGLRLASIGRLGSALRLLADARELCQNFGVIAYLPFVEAGFAVADWLGGNWDDALSQAAGAAEELRRSGRALTVAGVWTPWLAVSTNRGAFSESRQTLRRLLDGGVEQSRRDDEYLWWCDGRLMRLMGSHATAIASLERAAGLGADRPGGAMPLILAELVGCHWESGDVAAARHALGRLTEFADMSGLVFAAALRDQAALLVNGDTDAGERAREAFAAMRIPFEEAVTDLWLAHRADDAAAARRAYAGFAALGAEPWQRKAQAELKRLGLRAPRPAASARGPLALAPLEDKIGALVAQGMSNREVASVLCLSPKTVEGYLSRIYTKLAVRSRTELAAVLARAATASGAGDSP